MYFWWSSFSATVAGNNRDSSFEVWSISWKGDRSVAFQWTLSFLVWRCGLWLGVGIQSATPAPILRWLAECKWCLLKDDEMPQKTTWSFVTYLSGSAPMALNGASRGSPYFLFHHPLTLPQLWSLMTFFLTELSLTRSPSCLAIFTAPEEHRPSMLQSTSSLL